MKTTESVIRMGNDVPEVRHAPSIAGGEAHCHPKQLGVETEERKQVGQITGVVAGRRQPLRSTLGGHAMTACDVSGLILPQFPALISGERDHAGSVTGTIIDKCSAFPRCGCEYEGECYESININRKDRCYGSAVNVQRSTSTST